MLESLEGRQLLSTVTTGPGGVQAYIDRAGTLHVKGTSADDYISVTEQGGRITDLLVGSRTGTGTSAPAELTSFLGAPITGVLIDAGAGNDEVDFNGDQVDAVVWGNAGNDLLIINDYGTGTTIADGGAGDDVLICQTGHNTVLVGGDGNDTLAGATASGNCFIFAGNGNDTIELVGQDSFADGGNGTDTAIVVGQTLGTFRVENVTNV